MITTETKSIIDEIFNLIESIIDKCVIEEKKPKFSFYKYFVSSNIDKKTIEFIKENNFISKEKRNAELAYEKSDSYLEEAYGNFSRPHLRLYIELLEEIIYDIEKYHQEKSTIRRIRRNRKINITKIVKNLNYNKEQIIIGNTTYKSVEPSEIISKKQICLFNTKTKELTFYCGDYLNVKGSTIINFNPDKSWSKTVRNPEKILENVMKCTSSTTSSLKNLINTKEKIPTGRVNINHIIVKVFAS